MKIEIQNNKLIIDDLKVVSFETDIAQYIQFPDIIVVRLKLPTKKENFVDRNVFGVSLSGQIIWQIPSINTRFKSDPYIYIGKIDDELEAIHQHDVDLIVKPQTGEILSQKYSR